MLRRASAMAALLAALGAAGPASAHKPSESTLALDLRNGGGRWEIAIRDLDDALALDINGDGWVTWGEVHAGDAAIRAYARGALTLTSDRGACAIDVATVATAAHSDGNYASLP